MGKFTAADFNATTTTTTTTRRKLPTLIKIPAGRLHFPVAPPSPFFDGMNTDINTEPFPDFKDVVDLDPVEKEEPLHCILHCHHSICKRLVRRGFGVPPCRCAFEKREPLEDTCFQPNQPEFRGDDSIMESLPSISANTDPDQEINIRLSDVPELLAFLKEDSISANSAVPEAFFNDIRQYFNRTLCESGHRVLSVRQLRAELDFYVWTMNLASSDMTAAALRFCKERVNDVVGLMVWRDLEVRRYEEGKAEALLVVGSLSTYVLAAVVSHVVIQG